MNHETGQIASRTVERIKQTSRHGAKPNLFVSEGVRGIHLNELTRTIGGRIAAAFAELAWETMPMVGRSTSRQRVPERRQPVFAVGRDQRVGSPDIMLGVIAALLRMGCDVVDIGETTHAITEFAIEHLKVTGGIVVSGSGCGPSWVGMDFYAGPYRIVQNESDRENPAAEFHTSIKRIEQRFQQPVGRPCRDAGRTRTFHARVPYQAGLLKHFDSNRTKVCIASSRAIVLEAIRDAQTVNNGFTLVELPIRPRQLDNPDDPDVAQLANQITETRSAFGILIDDDGQRCAVLDHTGELLQPKSVLAILADSINAIRPGSSIVVEQSAYQKIRDILCDHPCYVAGDTGHEVRRAMEQHSASLAGGNSHRYWLEGPQCDAIITLTGLMQAINRSGRQLRTLADEIEFDRAAA